MAIIQSINKLGLYQSTGWLYKL